MHLWVGWPDSWNQSFRDEPGNAGVARPSSNSIHRLSRVLPVVHTYIHGPVIATRSGSWLTRYVVYLVSTCIHAYIMAVLGGGERLNIGTTHRSGSHVCVLVCAAFRACAVKNLGRMR